MERFGERYTVILWDYHDTCCMMNHDACCMMISTVIIRTRRILYRKIVCASVITPFLLCLDGVNDARLSLGFGGNWIGLLLVGG